jgi:Family of unknown function (DUF6166)
MAAAKSPCAVRTGGSARFGSGWTCATTARPGSNGGYGGSGPAQLALALLADACGDAATALEHYQEFKRDVVAGFGATWTLTAKDILRFVDCQRDKA